MHSRLLSLKQNGPVRLEQEPASDLAPSGTAGVPPDGRGREEVLRCPVGVPRGPGVGSGLLSCPRWQCRDLSQGGACFRVRPPPADTFCLLVHLEKREAVGAPGCPPVCHEVRQLQVTQERISGDAVPSAATASFSVLAGGGGALGPGDGVPAPLAR